MRKKNNSKNKNTDLFIGFFGYELLNNLIGVKLPKQKSINFPKGIFYKPETKINLKNNLIFNSSKINKINKNFKININIKKINLDKDNILENLEGFLILKDNKVSEANLDSSFLNKKKIKLTIKTDNDEKITTFFSGEAKPFVDRYKFINGFE